MLIPQGNAIRNASGDFGCPSCWGREGHYQAVSPEANPDNCPACGVELTWSYENRTYSKDFKDKRKLGWWGVPKDE